VEVNRFCNAKSLDSELAILIGNALSKDISRFGEAILVVSGGRTPIGLFNELARLKIDWGSVTVTLADERWVEASHMDSNERLVRDNLLLDRAKAAKFLPFKNNEKTASLGQVVCAERLDRLGKFSVVVLGMGDDGHTASLFPNSHRLGLGLDMGSTLPCIAIEPADVPHERITMTLPRLLHSQKVVLHIVGEGKFKTLESARTAADAFQYPVYALFQQRTTPVEIFYAP
jgi:6-phosphogluconolactonase